MKKTRLTRETGLSFTAGRLMAKRRNFLRHLQVRNSWTGMLKSKTPGTYSAFRFLGARTGVVPGCTL